MILRLDTNRTCLPSWLTVFNPIKIPHTPHWTVCVCNAEQNEHRIQKHHLVSESVCVDVPHSSWSPATRFSAASRGVSLQLKESHSGYLLFAQSAEMERCHFFLSHLFCRRQDTDEGFQLWHIQKVELSSDTVGARFLPVSSVFL